MPKIGKRTRTNIHAIVLYGDLFSSTIITATGMAVIKNTKEKMRQNSFHSPIYYILLNV